MNNNKLYFDDIDFIIKLKSRITFFIDNIVGFCFNEGGIYSYVYFITFLQDLTYKDIQVTITDDKKKLDFIYNKKTRKFDMKCVIYNCCIIITFLILFTMFNLWFYIVPVVVVLSLYSALN